MNTTRVPKVYIVEPTDAGLDVSSLYDYGEVTFLFGETEKRPPIWRADYVDSVMTKLAANGYDPLVDYFAVVGRMVPVVMVTTSLAARWPEAKLLYFSSTSREYVERPAVIAGSRITTLSSSR